jgi:hypothetical protein
MIRIEIRRDAEGRIRGFTVAGHAGYDEAGKDLVCAAVSAVTIGTVNAAEALLGADLRPETRDGYLRAEVPGGLGGETESRLQLLLESMTVMLDGIASSYGEHVALKETKVRSEN